MFNKLRILALCSPVVLGLAPLSIAATVHVDAAFVGVETGSLTNPFNTIQEGITAAAANDTVQVAAGTYVEQIDFLGKNIAVVGAGAETTTIRTPLGRSVVLTRTDLPTCGGNRAVDAAVWIENTTSARLSGFTVDGNNSLIYTFSGTPVRTVGIGLKAARAVIEHCRVQRVRDPSGDGNQGGLAIYVCFNGSNVSITNNTVVDCQKGGIVINGHSGNLITPACTAGDAQAPHAQITGNVVLGHGKTWAIAFNGIQVGFGATAVITNNVVSGCYYEGTSAASGGILLVGSGPCTVEGNIATANNVGIWATDVDFGFGNIAVGAGVYRGNILNNPQNGDPLSFADNAFDDNAASLWDANTYHNFDGAHGFPAGYDIGFSTTAGVATVDVNAAQLDVLDWTDLDGPSSTATAADPQGMALGQFNGDGKLDVATACESSNSVSVLLNDGSGALLAAATTTSATQLKGARAITAGNFVGDANLDLAVACKSGNTVTLLQGDGVGGFTIAGTVAVSTGPYAIASADLDGDADADLVVTTVGTPFFTPGGVTVLMNGPFGTFTPTALTAPGAGFGQVQGVAVGDLGGSALPEIVAVDGDTGLVLVYENTAGTFGAPLLPDPKLSPSEVVKPRSAVVGDVNFDRRNDIVITNLGNVPTNFGDVRVLLHSPVTTVTFGPALAFEAGTFPTAVAVGELYTDQLAGGDRTGLDMVTANFGASSLTQLNGFLGAVTPSASVKSDGAFLAQSDFALGALPTAVAIEDMNGDGFDDVVATVTGVTNAVRVFLGPVQALVEPYGFGCPGTGGTVPVNSAIGLPTIGNANFTDTLSNAAPFHANFLALGVGPANAEYGFTGSGCFLLVNPSPIFLTFRSFTDASGSSSIGLPIPGAPVLAGLQVYTQWLVFDAAGPSPGIVFSNGLRIRLGF